MNLSESWQKAGFPNLNFVDRSSVLKALCYALSQRCYGFYWQLPYPICYRSVTSLLQVIASRFSSYNQTYYTHYSYDDLPRYVQVSEYFQQNEWKFPLLQSLQDCSDSVFKQGCNRCMEFINYINLCQIRRYDQPSPYEIGQINPDFFVDYSQVKRIGKKSDVLYDTQSIYSAFSRISSQLRGAPVTISSCDGADLQYSVSYYLQRYSQYGELVSMQGKITKVPSSRQLLVILTCADGLPRNGHYSLFSQTRKGSHIIYKGIPQDSETDFYQVDTSVISDMVDFFSFNRANFDVDEWQSHYAVSSTSHGIAQYPYYLYNVEVRMQPQYCDHDYDLPSDEKL